jgi:hypothetical protein
VSKISEKFQKLIGYKWWELMIMSSVIFSVCSLMIWFNILEPKQNNQNLTSIEYAKHELFSLWQRIDYDNQKIDQKIQTSGGQCKSFNGQSMDNNLKNFVNKLDSLKTNIDSNLWNQRFAGLKSAWDRYAIVIKTKEDVFIAGLNLLNQINPECKTSFSMDKDEAITKSIEIDNNYKFASLRKTIEKFYDSEGISNFSEIYKNFFNKTEYIENLKNATSNIQSKFQEIEKWEAEQIKNTNLKIEVIYIYKN